MLPVFSTNNVPDRLEADSKLIPNESERVPAAPEKPYFSNGIFVKLGRMMSNSLYLTIFRNHVVHVVIICSESKVCGIHTRWIVSIRTIVKHLKAIWDRPVMDYPRKSVCADCLSVAGGFSISVICNASSPQPAFIFGGLDNVFPKMLHGIVRWVDFLRLRFNARTRFDVRNHIVFSGGHTLLGCGFRV